MSTGFLLSGFILVSVRLICSNVGLSIGLSAQHLTINWKEDSHVTCLNVEFNKTRVIERDHR